jgi:catechol 2,3-dioxygenase-like lactoylglutathione lyase family enzyme
MDTSEYAFDHVAQVVPNIAQAVSWYRDNLPGIQVLYQDETWAFVEAGGVKLAFVVRDQHPGHLAWRVSTAELERLAARHGKEIKPHRDGTRSFYLEAPGGQSIEIICIEGSRWDTSAQGEAEADKDTSSTP